VQTCPGTTANPPAVGTTSAPTMPPTTLSSVRE
jgi:hypothetical protein